MTVQLDDELEALAHWLDAQSSPITVEEVRSHHELSSPPVSRGSDEGATYAEPRDAEPRLRPRLVAAVGVAAVVVTIAVVVSQGEHHPASRVETPTVSPATEQSAASSPPAGQWPYPGYVPVGNALRWAQYYRDPYAPIGFAVVVAIPGGSQLERVAQIALLSNGSGTGPPSTPSPPGTVITPVTVRGLVAQEVWDAPRSVRHLDLDLGQPLGVLTVTGSGDWVNEPDASTVLHDLAEAVTIAADGSFTLPATLPDGYAPIGEPAGFGVGNTGTLDYTDSARTGVDWAINIDDGPLLGLAPLPASLQVETIRGGKTAVLTEANPKGGPTWYTLSWIESPGTVVTLAGDLELAELLKIADGLASLTEDQWRTRALSETPNHAFGSVAPTAPESTSAG